MESKTEQNLQDVYREYLKYAGRISRYEKDLEKETKQYENTRTEHWNAARKVGEFWIEMASETAEETPIIGALAIPFIAVLGLVTTAVASIGDIVASPFIAGFNKNKKVECNKLKKLAEEAKQMIPKAEENLESAVKQAIKKGADIKVVPAYSETSWDKKPLFRKTEIEIGGISVDYKLFNKCLIDLGATRLPGEMIPLDKSIETAANEISQKGEHFKPKAFTIPSIERAQPEQNN